MGVYNKHTWANAAISLENFKAWIDSLNCPLITTSISDGTFYIHVDDAANLCFGLYYSSGFYYAIGYQLRGNSVRTSTFNDYGGNTVVVCFSDDVFYLQIKNNYGPNDRKSIFIYEKLDEKRYFMGTGSDIDGDTNPWYSIEGKTFLCLENDLNYTHESRLKYTQALNYIDYTYDHLLLSGEEITNIEDSNFSSCSTVELNRVISFNGQNFYTTGTNILFPID